uniref:NADH dehydrogenase subunit 2 n=1 Tax=Entricoplax vestita TaxID=2115857 RepID=UPI002E78A941|nr:NADH dehydrogenase subunit 2 [Entricoplax vestita]WRI34039.1 NADH dehydrogenase subunit 2 [Entricoplax vestita]
MTFPFFFFFLISGTILSISSTSWFGAWIGLELNLMSFIPLISIKMNSYFSEAALKYFLIQALASTFIIMSTCLLLPKYNFSSFLITMALLLKLGAAPFHFWFPQVMEGLSWYQTIILMTIQKLAPMFLLSYFVISSFLTKIISLSAIMSAIVGAVGGLNMMKLRKIMAFSSINHMSWMLIAISMNQVLWLTYFLFYAMISSSVVFFFHSLQTFTISNLMSSSYNNSFMFLMAPISLLSLGGLPPFTGFLPKWLMIQHMIMNNLFITLAVLLISALTTLYFYLRITIPLFLLILPNISLTMKPNLFSSTSLMSFALILNLLGLVAPFCIF